MNIWPLLDDVFDYNDWTAMTRTHASRAGLGTQEEGRALDMHPSAFVSPCSRDVPLQHACATIQVYRLSSMAESWMVYPTIWDWQWLTLTMGAAGTNIPVRVCEETSYGLRPPGHVAWEQAASTGPTGPWPDLWDTWVVASHQTGMFWGLALANHK